MTAAPTNSAFDRFNTLFNGTDQVAGGKIFERQLINFQNELAKADEATLASIQDRVENAFLAAGETSKLTKAHIKVITGIKTGLASAANAAAKSLMDSCKECVPDTAAAATSQPTASTSPQISAAAPEANKKEGKAAADKAPTGSNVTSAAAPAASAPAAAQTTPPASNESPRKTSDSKPVAATSAAAASSAGEADRKTADASKSAPAASTGASGGSKKAHDPLAAVISLMDVALFKNGDINQVFEKLENLQPKDYEAFGKYLQGISKEVPFAKKIELDSIMLAFRECYMKKETPEGEELTEIITDLILKDCEAKLRDQDLKTIITYIMEFEKEGTDVPDYLTRYFKDALKVLQDEKYDFNALKMYLKGMKEQLPAEDKESLDGYMQDIYRALVDKDGIPRNNKCKQLVDLILSLLPKEMREELLAEYTKEEVNKKTAAADASSDYDVTLLYTRRDIRVPVSKSIAPTPLVSAGAAAPDASAAIKADVNLTKAAPSGAAAPAQAAKDAPASAGRFSPPKSEAESKTAASTAQPAPAASKPAASPAQPVKAGASPEKRASITAAPAVSTSNLTVKPIVNTSVTTNPSKSITATPPASAGAANNVARGTLASSKLAGRLSAFQPQTSGGSGGAQPAASASRGSIVGKFSFGQAESDTKSNRAAPLPRGPVSAKMAALKATVGGTATAAVALNLQVKAGAIGTLTTEQLKTVIAQSAKLAAEVDGRLNDTIQAACTKDKKLNFEQLKAKAQQLMVAQVQLDTKKRNDILEKMKANIANPETFNKIKEDLENLCFFVTACHGSYALKLQNIHAQKAAVESDSKKYRDSLDSNEKKLAYDGQLQALKKRILIDKEFNGIKNAEEAAKITESLKSQYPLVAAMSKPQSNEAANSEDFLLRGYVGESLLFHKRYLEHRADYIKYLGQQEFDKIDAELTKLVADYSVQTYQVWPYYCFVGGGMTDSTVSVDAVLGRDKSAAGSAAAPATAATAPTTAAAAGASGTPAKS
jgi:hypothetical protein